MDEDVCPLCDNKKPLGEGFAQLTQKARRVQIPATLSISGESITIHSL